MRRIITFCVMAFCIAITPTETKAQNPQKGDYGYLYCHMSGRGEWTAYAIATAGDIPAMAGAFRQAIEAGRAAYRAGLGRVLARGGSASDPLTGFLR